MKKIEPHALKDRILSVRVIDTYLSGWAPADVFDKFKRSPRPFSALFFVIKDIECVYIEIDEKGREVKRIRCRKGDILYIPRGVMYHALFESRMAAEEVSTCTVNFDLFDADREEVVLDAHILLLGNKVNHFMLDDLMDIYKCTRNPLDHNKLRINSIYFSILYYATRAVGERESTKAIKRIVAQIEEEWDQNVHMEQYATRCNMSLTYFYREFKSHTGTSPTKFRNEIRINAAKSYMNNTDMTIKEIAEKTGFADEFYFSRLFKKTTGISPSQFKRE